MLLVINDQPTQVPESCQTVASLLAHLDLGYPVLVERNGTALFLREFPETNLREGDRLELMRMVAGG
jgi:thiamine biosynthesis protein ThiS